MFDWRVCPLSRVCLHLVSFFILMYGRDGLPAAGESWSSGWAAVSNDVFWFYPSADEMV